ncbi:MAG: hypothetical protein OXF06_05545 [Bacteroidetes bacterium]|nr:hypothetical protein [Bacteroidota bacterium]MCY4224283.1 hypothetical protein [Bacteroidota bacterium]
MTIAISTSDSPDMAFLGFGEGHLKDAMSALAIQLLAANTNLTYGGDLRVHGFSQILFQLVLKYTPQADYRHTVRVTNHLAWPVHIGMPFDRIDALSRELKGAAQLILLERDGTPMSMEKRRNTPMCIPNEEDWSSGLTAMREFQTSFSNARVLLGGQVSNYKGRMPGVAEEAYVSLSAKQPLFLIGGFGGCTRDVAEVLGLVEPWKRSRKDWDGRKEFTQWSGLDLNNGLTLEENKLLANSTFLGQSVVLVLRGVYNLLHEHHGELIN